MAVKYLKACMVNLVKVRRWMLSSQGQTVHSEKAKGMLREMCNNMMGNDATVARLHITIQNQSVTVGINCSSPYDPDKELPVENERLTHSVLSLDRFSIKRW